MFERQFDVEIKGRSTEEELVYDLNVCPKQRMLFCSAFYNLWADHKGIKRVIGYETFMKHFNEVYRNCKKESRPLAWQDFENLNP